MNNMFKIASRVISNISRVLFYLFILEITVSSLVSIYDVVFIDTNKSELQLLVAISTDDRIFDDIDDEEHEDNEALQDSINASGIEQ